MRLVVLASGPFAIPTLRALRDDANDIPLVVTQPDRKSGRGRKLTPTPAGIAAKEMGLDVIPCADVNQPEVIERVRALEADLGVVIDFGQKILAPFRDAFRGGCVNLHASLLPEYRGAAPFQWAVINGERTTGVTVFKIVDRMDAGPVLTVRPTDIRDHETADELHDRLALLGPPAVAEAISMFEGGHVPEGTPQDEARATKAPKLHKSDSPLDFNQPAPTMVRRILGLWSWPQATCRFADAGGHREERVAIARARVAEATGSERLPGTLNDRLHVVTGDGCVEFLQIKPQSGKLMPWSAFVNGRHVRPGDRFM
jgi:methionyl-tRNA formyltransferase